MSKKNYSIALIPGDGIGTEVIEAGLKVLRVLEEKDGGFKLNVEHFPWGSDYYREHGTLGEYTHLRVEEKKP